MELYAYKAVDSYGAEIKGFTQGRDISDIYRELSAKGFHVLSVKKEHQMLVGVIRFFETWRVKRTDIIEFSSNLSMMLKAGVPILTALEDISSTLDNKVFKNVVENITREVQMGMRFSDALAMHRQYFPDIFVRLATIGEESGQLDNSLKEIADHLQRMEDLVASIKRALMYPVFAVVTTTGALIFWLAFVLPKMVPVIKDMGVKLPPLTLFLMFASDFTQKYWFTAVLIPFIVLPAIKILGRIERVKYYYDYAKIKVPIVKLIIYNKLLAIFTEQFRILIMAGLPMDRIFDIVSGVISNKVFEKAILETKERVMSGESISSSLKAQPVFPPLVIRMVDIGETSGSLDNQFGFLAEHYLKKLDDISEKLGKILEPVIMVVLGGLFAIIIMGLMLPIYELVSKFGKG
ncbi:MAG: type II secretion system F family protein [Nitrospirae bacterium]|nr:MAG: type II secretion system F family protein [Nitrospirota bacterium]